MATLISNANGNLTGSTTFAAAEAGALATVLIRNNFTNISAAGTVTSVTFTVTNAKVIDGVMLWLKTAAGTPTGTFKVDLQKGGVSQASVTVNKADLPDVTNTIYPPVFFKFTGTATGDGGSNWTLVLTTTGTIVVSIMITSGTITSYTRALRTTTAATPAAADDLYILGELTGAGTKNVRAVTMDSTAATAYGNGTLNTTGVAGGTIAVSWFATLAYGTSASTNYILRVAGDVIVYVNGTFTIGASGAEIPRTSTAVLEFQPVSVDGDFGLQILDNAVCNMAGLSRTSGKNVVSCKLTSDLSISSTLTGANNAGSSTFVSLEATGNSLLAGLFTDNATNTTHFVSYLWAVTNVPGNTTQVASLYLARGAGTNNRYVRVLIASSLSAAPTNGCYVDIDLQAGTAGTATAIGNGTATSASITAVGAGFNIRLTGRVSTASTSPFVIIAACSAAGTVTYAGNTTGCFIYDHVNLATTATPADTTFNVDIDTGWLSGDAVCVASTTRTAAECEIFPLNANAGSSSITSALACSAQNVGVTTGVIHSGTTPTQAEIILLTRNVKVRSTSTTLSTYVYATALAVFNASWVEFSRLGANVTTKRGLEIQCTSTSGTAGVKSISYCSIHDGDLYGVMVQGSSAYSANLTLSYCNFWNMPSTHIWLSVTIVLGDWTIDNCIMMKSASTGITLADVGGTLTNTTVIGTTSTGFDINESISALVGTWSGLTAHSNSVAGFGLAGCYGTISNTKSWRNLSSGMSIAGSSIVLNNITLDTYECFGNITTNLSFSAGSSSLSNVRLVNGSLNGDTTFSTTNAVTFTNGFSNVIFDNLNTSASGIKTVCTNDFNTGAWVHKVLCRNCLLGAATLITDKTVFSPDSYFAFQKYNQTAGDHRTELKYGQLKTDSTIYNTAPPSMRMTPSSATNKLESAIFATGIQCAVNNGSTVSPTVYVRKSTSGDGAAYTGNQPRLIVRANPAIGITSDTVLATYSAGTGAWNTLSGTTAAATDDGVMEFIVDCDGTAGWINLDDWSFT